MGVAARDRARYPVCGTRVARCGWGQYWRLENLKSFDEFLSDRIRSNGAANALPKRANSQSANFLLPAISSRRSCEICRRAKSTSLNLEQSSLVQFLRGVLG